MKGSTTIRMGVYDNRIYGILSVLGSLYVFLSKYMLSKLMVDGPSPPTSSSTVTPRERITSPLGSLIFLTCIYSSVSSIFGWMIYWTSSFMFAVLYTNPIIPTIKIHKNHHQTPPNPHLARPCYGYISFLAPSPSSSACPVKRELDRR
jgi:hypothetical protein